MYIYICMYFELYWVGTIIIPFLQMVELRHRVFRSTCESSHSQHVVRPSVKPSFTLNHYTLLPWKDVRTGIADAAFCEASDYTQHGRSPRDETRVFSSGNQLCLKSDCGLFNIVSQNIPPFFSLKLLWVLFLCQPKDLGLFICWLFPLGCDLRIGMVFISISIEPSIIHITDFQ